MHDKPAQQFTVLRVVLESGERLPCLVDSETWIPVRVATRWAVRFRRLRTQSSTLTDNLRIIGRVYLWARTVGEFDLDEYLTQGQLLSARHLESFSVYLQRSRDDVGMGNTTQFNDAGTYDQQLAVVEKFLLWALYSENRGGIRLHSLEQLAAEQTRIEAIFESLLIGARPSQRLEPLEDNDIRVIRDTISPKKDADGKWMLPPQTFSQSTQLRNWLMFETALQLGLRRGELLKLRLDSLSRGDNSSIVVKRLADDPRDSRAREPAVKTAEREIPMGDDLHQAFHVYLTSPPPLGRVRGKTPYLFTTLHGDPVSVDRSDDIIQAIGRYSGVHPLSWHRLRHTWAERIAETLYREPNGMEQLAYLGGWTNLHSSERYIERAKRRHATEWLRKYQSTLYSEES